MSYDTLITVRKIANGYTVQLNGTAPSDAVFAADVAAVGEAVATSMAARLLNPLTKEAPLIMAQWGAAAPSHWHDAARYGTGGLVGNLAAADHVQDTSLMSKIKNWSF